MADAQTTIDLIFNGVDKTGAATQAALQNIEKFGGSIQTATQLIADFTLGAVKIEAAILAAGAALTVFAVKTAGEFDSSFNQISTLIDASGSDLEGFRQAVLNYASTSGKSFEDVTAAFSAALGAGVEYGESIELITTAEKLSIATRADLKGTTEVLVSTLNAYGMETKDAGVLADQMFTIIKDGKIEMNDLAQSLAMVTPVAAAAGVGMDEVGAAIATLTAAGMQPSSAIEGLRSALANIVAPSQQAKDLAASLGLEFGLTALQTKGLSGFLDDVQVATGGSADKMKILFGDVTGFTSVLTLAGPQADKFRGTIENMGNSAGAVAKAYAEMANNIDISAQKIKNSFEGLLTNFGDQLLDEFDGVAKAIAAVFNAIGVSINKGELDEIIGFIEQRMRGLQSTLQTVAQNIPEALKAADLSGFIDGIEAIRDAFGGIFDGIDLTSVDGLQSAIENVGAAFKYLSNYVAGVIDSFKPLADLLFDTSEGFKNIDAESARSAGQIGGFVTQLNLLSGPMTTVAASLLALTQAMKIAGSITAVTAALASLSAAVALPVAGVAALSAAVGVSAFAFASMIDKVTELTTGTSLSTFFSDLFSSDIEDQVALVTSGLEEIVVTAKRIGDSEGPDALNESLQEVTVSARMWGETAAEAARRQEIARASSEKWAEGLDYAAPLWDLVTGKIIGFGEAASRVDGAMDKAAEATKGFNLEAEKLKSQEVLALIEASSAVSVARIEADAMKTVAAFESITGAIQSTGETLTSLYGLLGDENISKFDKLGIKEQIKDEAEFREREFNRLDRLADAQIKSLNAQADALRSGDPLITINGDGLAPHLEAMMFEVLKAVQVRVNADGYAMLLGAN